MSYWISDCSVNRRLFFFQGWLNHALPTSAMNIPTLSSLVVIFFNIFYSCQNSEGPAGRKKAPGP